jgi:hypothetical protein
MPSSLTPFEPLRPGDPLPQSARAENARINAARAHQRAKMGVLGGTGQPRQIPSGCLIVLVQNKSDADRKRFDVLGIDESIIKPADNLFEFANRVALKAVTPVIATHKSRFVVLIEPIAKDGFGRGYIDGVCPAVVEMTDAGDQFADVKDNDATTLKSGPDGSARILWKEQESGSTWAVVQLGVGGGGITAPQYQGMVYQGVANNQPGWDYCPAVETV